ncbi:nuclear transport factor 2 family protein [Prolixibacteraceae bacterium JC049]|jgi:ketosteroid isomerase-like protein|nr:nuclear transport factor 2 family protein [Prolixibacteraceae bacterium JC049]
MRRLLIISMVLVALVACETKQPKTDLKQDEKEVRNVLSNFFKAVGEHDWERMKGMTTKDMILVEHDMVWNTDSLINAMDKYWKGYTVEYSVDFIKIYVTGRTAWAVYRNDGVVSNNEREIHVGWIETVIFAKKNGKWKIIGLQSTRVKEPRVVIKDED